MSGYRELWGLKDFKSSKGLKIANINIGSLNAHNAEFYTVFSDNQIDIINVSESWLKDNTDPKIFTLDGYNIIRQDRHTATSGGGLISYVANKYKINTNKYAHLNTNNKDFEMLIYDIELPRSRPMVIISCYKPPHIKYDIANEKLSTAIDNINNNVELFLIGDLNVDYKLKHGHRYSKVKNFENKNLLKQYINSTTRPKEKSSTAIDHIYSNSNNILSIGTLLWKPADHLATFIIRKPEKIVKESEMILSRRASDFDEYAISIKFENENWDEFYESKCVNRKWAIMRILISKVINMECPVREFRRTINREKWVTDELLTLLDLRDTSVKKAIRTNRDSDWDVAKKLRKETRIHVDKARNDYIKNVLKEHEKDPRKFWRTLTPKINNKKLKINSDAEKLTNMASKNLAVKFNEFFCNIGKNLDNKLEVYNKNTHPFNQAPRKTIPIFNFTRVTENDVMKIINKLSIHKGSEIPDISTFFLKGSFQILVNQMTDIINTSLETGKIPDEWKIGRLQPIYKGEGSKEEAGNYRPITLLPLPGKILERVVNTQVRSFLERNDLYAKNQFGFRSNLSTADAIETVTREIIINQNIGRHVSATFLDLRKAFDVVNHEILLNKLKWQYNFDEKVINWFKNYLSNRQQYTKINEAKSPLENINCGVPQGSILGPTLFTLYINDLENVFTASKVYLYADDTVILNFHEDIDSLTNCVNRELSFYHNWLLYNRLTVNPKKSNVVLFKGYGQRINCRLKPITLGKDVLSYVQSYKYLGIWIDAKLRFDIHIKKILKDVSFRLSRLFRIRNTITENIALRIYKVMVLPLIDYGDIIYLTGTKTSIKKLDVLQKKALRIIGKINKRNSTKDISERLQVLDLNKRRLYHLLQYAYKISFSDLNIKKIQKVTRYNE